MKKEYEQAISKAKQTDFWTDAVHELPLTDYPLFMTLSYWLWAFYFANMHGENRGKNPTADYETYWSICLYVYEASGGTESYIPFEKPPLPTLGA